MKNTITPPRLALVAVGERRKGVRRLRLARVISDLGPVLAADASPKPAAAPAQGVRAP